MKRDLLVPAVRRQLVRLPAPHAAHYGVVPMPPPEEGILLSSVRARHEAAIAAIARVDALAATTQMSFLVSRLLPRREAVSSSAIEGTQSTLAELLTIEETSDVGARYEAKQVRSYAHLLSDLVEEAKQRGPSIFTIDLVKRLHRRVMHEDPSYRDTPGELRKVVVWIGGHDIAQSTWNPPPPDDVEGCLEQSLDYMRSEGMQQMTQSIVARMAIGHAHFEAVHPFRDGNGRVGRFLMPLAMAAEGHVPLYLSAYIEAHRSRYYDALKKATQKLDWAAIVGFFSDAIVGTVVYLEETVGLLRALLDNWSQRRIFRASSAAERALEILVDYPVTTAKGLARALGVGFAPAAAALAQLEAVGIVEERTGYRRNRVFVAEEVLAIVDRPFDSE